MSADVMTLREHLEELRRRLLLVVAFIVLAMVAAFVFRDPRVRVPPRTGLRRPR